MEDVKVLVLTIWPKTVMNSNPHFAIMAAIIPLPNVTCKVSKLSHSEICLRFFLLPRKVQLDNSATGYDKNTVI